MKEQRFLETAARFANLVFLGASLVCVLALSYFVYYYGWTGQRQFSNWNGVLFSYVLPAALAAASLACLRLPASRKINVALLLFSAGASIAIAETLLTVWSNLPSVNLDALVHARMEAAEALGKDWDTRSKIEVVEDLRREGHDAVPGLFSQGFLAKQDDGAQKSVIDFSGPERLPLAGISNKLTVVCNETGQYVSYRSDEHGFNNPEHLWDMPSMDVAAVGDSYVQIWCVPPEKHFVSLIRNRHSATLNLGIEGNGPLTMLATIKEYAQVVKPKVVLWFYFEGNDFQDLQTEQMAPILMGYLNGGFSQGLFERQSEIDAALTKFIETSATGNTELRTKLKEITALVRDTKRVPQFLKSITRLEQLRQGLGLVQGQRNESLPGTGSDQEAREKRMAPTMDLFRRILVEAKNTVHAWGGELCFIYLPAWNRYAPGQERNSERDAVLRVAHSVELPVIDIHQTFLTQPDPLNLFQLRLPGHYTEEGNGIVAEEVLRSISFEE